VPDSQTIKIKHPGNTAKNRENQIRLPDRLCQLCPGGAKLVDFFIHLQHLPTSLSKSVRICNFFSLFNPFSSKPP
jgi:hypothetical protein